MSTVPLPTPTSLLAPDLARRVGVIVAALAALIARRFLAEPRLVALIIPLWNRLTLSARRFERLMARLAAGRLPIPRRCTVRSVRPVPPPHRTGLPTGRGWLVRALGYEAVGYASQLEHLLAEPGVADLLAAAPAAQRILRPLRHMLGVGPAPRRQAGRVSSGTAHDALASRRVRKSMSAVTRAGRSPPGGVSRCSAIGGGDQSDITATSRPAARSCQTMNSG